MAVQTTSNWGRALTPGVKKWYGAAYAQKPEIGKTIFQMETSTRNFEEFVGVTGYALYTVKTQGGEITLDTMQQGFVSRFTHVVYASGFIVTREMHDDDQYNIMKQQTMSLAFSGVASRETICANILNRATTGGFVGGDGSTLLSTTHANRSGGTWSNKLAIDAALSETTLEQMTINIKGYKNDRGIFIEARARKLIVANENGPEACRILKSTLQNDTANNAINVLKYQGLIPEGFIEWSYLTNPKAYFIQTDVPYGLVYVKRDDDEFGGMPENDWGTENAKYRNRLRFSVGWVDPRGLQGSSGTPA